MTSKDSRLTAACCILSQFVFADNRFQQSMQAIKVCPAPQDARLLSNYSAVSTMKLSVAPVLWLNGPASWSLVQQPS